MSVIQESLTESGFTILNFVEHAFQPQGYTCLWLLGESHAAMHTFPEENKTYIELSSCAKALLINFDVSLNNVMLTNQLQLIPAEDEII